ncbi:unnamed protein product [Gordionus sp. m RMFG-2023]
MGNSIYRPDPDSPWSYVVLVCSMLNHFVLYGTGMSFSVFFKALIDSFQSSRATTAWFNSIQSGVFNFSGPIVSLLLKRYNWRVLLISGGLLNGLGLSLSFFANSIYFLNISIGFLVGFGYGCMHVSSVVALGAYFTRPAERSFAQGMNLAGGGLGTLVMPLISYKLIAKYGFRGAFLIIGALMFQTIVFSCLILPFTARSLHSINKPKSPSRKKFLRNADDMTEPKVLDGIKSGTNGTNIVKIAPPELNSITDEATQANIDESDLEDIDKDQVVDLGDTNSIINLSIPFPTLRSPRLLLYMAQSAFWTASVFIVVHLLFDFLITDRHLRPQVRAAFLFTILMTSMFVGNITGALLDTCFMFCKKGKGGKERISSSICSSNTFNSLSKRSTELQRPNLTKSWIFIVCTLIHGAIATPLFLATRRYDLLCITAVAFGIPCGIKLALVPTICVDLFGLAHLSHVYGYSMMASGVGILISPPLGGYLVDKTKSYHVTFALSAILSVISAIFFTILLIIASNQRSVRYFKVSIVPNDDENFKVQRSYNDGISRQRLYL